MSELKHEFTKNEIEKLALAVVSSKTWSTSNVNDAIDLYLTTIEQVELRDKEHREYNQPIKEKKAAKTRDEISKYFRQ